MAGTILSLVPFGRNRLCPRWSVPPEQLSGVPGVRGSAGSCPDLPFHVELGECGFDGAMWLALVISLGVSSSLSALEAPRLTQPTSKAQRR